MKPQALINLNSKIKENMGWVMTLLLLLTLASTTVAQPYHVTGKVYCDNCRFGFETNITGYVPGATVKLECKDKTESRVVFNITVTTDSSGSFEFVVYEDHGDQDCDVVLVKSPWPHCKILDRGRYKSRVIVTDFNGIQSNHRYANNLGFVQNKALPVCAQLRRYYFNSDDDQ